MAHAERLMILSSNVEPAKRAPPCLDLGNSSPTIKLVGCPRKIQSKKERIMMGERVRFRGK